MQAVSLHSPDSRQQERNFIWQSLALVLVIFLLPGLLLSPFHIDQGLYAAVAKAMLQKHQLPYVAGWDVKGPLTFFLIAGAFLLLGIKTWALHTLDLLFLGVGAWSLARLDRDRAVGAATLVLFLGLIGLNICVTSQPDFWATFLCFGMLAGLRSPHRAAPFLAGLLLGLCIQMKESYALIGLCALIAYIRPFNLRALLQFGLGAALPFLIVVLVYTWYGALGILWQDHWSYLLETHMQTGFYMERAFLFILPEWPNSVPHALKFCFALGLDALLLATLPGYLVWRQRDRHFSVVLLVFFLMTVLALFLQQRFLTSHYTPVIAAACLLAAPLVLDHWKLWKVRLLVAAMLLRAPMLLVGGGAVFPEAWPYALGRMEAPAFTQLFNNQNSHNVFCPSCIEEAAKVIRTETRPDQSVLIWGFDVLPAIWAERDINNRLTHVYPLVATTGERRRRYRAELMVGLQASPPALVVVENDDLARLDTTNLESSRQQLATFPELQDWMTKNCSFLQGNSSFDLYTCGQNAAPNLFPEDPSE